METETHLIFATKDTVREEFFPPFIAKTIKEAWRNYHVSLSNDRYASQHMDEFELYYLGSWNNETGELLSAGAPSLMHQTIKEA